MKTITATNIPDDKYQLVLDFLKKLKIPVIETPIANYAFSESEKRSLLLLKENSPNMIVLFSEVYSRCFFRTWIGSEIPLLFESKHGCEDVIRKALHRGVETLY